jgi:uncharacterized protein (DUF1330 family)
LPGGVGAHAGDSTRGVGRIARKPPGSRTGASDAKPTQSPKRALVVRATFTLNFWRNLSGRFAVKLRHKTAVALCVGICIGALAIEALHAQAKPPAFLIFEAEIKDAAAYQPFLQTAVKEVQAQGGKFLVAGAKPEVLSGAPTPNIVSISQWNNKEDIIRWFNSDAMKPVREAQAKYTVTRLSLVEGKAP